MLTPEGSSGDDMEKLMLLSIWAHTVHKESSDSPKPFIFAGIGKPTYPVNKHMVASYQGYWERIDTLEL